MVAVYNRKPLNRDSTSSQNWMELKKTKNKTKKTFILLLSFYTNIATEYKSQPDIQTRGSLNMNKICAKYTRFSI